MAEQINHVEWDYRPTHLADRLRSQQLRAHQTLPKTDINPSHSPELN